MLLKGWSGKAPLRKCHLSQDLKMRNQPWEWWREKEFHLEVPLHSLCKGPEMELIWHIEKVKGDRKLGNGE